MNKSTVFVCNCTDISHHIIVDYDADPAWPCEELYFNILLNKHGNFWVRMKRAFTYLTGIGEYNPCYAELILDRVKIRSMIEALEEGEKHLAHGTNKQQGELYEDDW